MEFIDLKAQYQAYKTEIDQAMAEVVSSAQFINGPAVKALEQELAAFTGATQAIGCANGTDALMVPLMALGVGPGDEVIVPDFTFFATAEMVALVGATPVFVDIEDRTFNLDPAKIEAKITPRTKGIIPVSLYGQCADLEKINAIAAKHGLWVMEDAAQSFGATYHGKRSCNLTRVATTSFFPAKPLGCYGDGGAIFTSDETLAATMRCIVNHGQKKRYEHCMIGINGRLDTVQAAVLRVKLKYFNDEIAARQKVAGWYTASLKDVVRTPFVEAHNLSVWAQYTVRVPNRDAVIQRLQAKGIPTAIHYPIPLHRQEVFRALGVADAECPVSCRLAAEVFSLPMHPFLKEEEVRHIARCVCESL